ncbi:hypothetical protein ABPG75_008919 [Micractinium tetrahymenae]
MAGATGDEEAVQLLDAPRSSTMELELDATSKLGGHEAASRALQASHFLSTWGQRGWEFNVGLLMLELHPSSLAFVALWGLLDSALAAACGGAVGAWVDRQPRLAAASRMYLLQNCCVAASAATALALLLSRARSGALYWLGLGVTMAAGSASTLGALGSTLSVEREWTKTLCGGDHAALASLNAAMKRIDLTCLIASPLMVGLVMQYAGGPPMVGSTLALLAWNMLAWWPEVLLLRRAQRLSPALAADKPPRRAGAGSSEHADDGAGSGGGTGSGSSSRDGGLAAALRRQARPWAQYARQPAAAPALALALLYLTVMSWGTLMTAYLKSEGLPEAELALYRGLGAVSGILATLAFPPLHRWLGLVPTGAAAIWLQLACLLGGAGPAVAAAAGAPVGSGARVYALVWGLVLSRFGLWSFDLAANQLIQETVDHGSLGAVSGVQGSLQSLLQMLAYLAGVVQPGTQQFPWLMAASCCAVGAAAALVTAFAVRTGCGRRLPGLALEPVG